MQYLLELYQNDFPGIIEVLQSIKVQLAVLPDELRTSMLDKDVSGVKYLCHKAANNAILIGDKSLKESPDYLESSIAEGEVGDQLRWVVVEVEEKVIAALKLIEIQKQIYER